ELTGQEDGSFGAQDALSSLPSSQDFLLILKATRTDPAGEVCLQSVSADWLFSAASQLLPSSDSPSGHSYRYADNNAESGRTVTITINDSFETLIIAKTQKGTGL